MRLYLSRIEGPPPKRNVVSSSLAGGAKNDRCKPFFDGLQRFLLPVLVLPLHGNLTPAGSKQTDCIRLPYTAPEASRRAFFVKEL